MLYLNNGTVRNKREVEGMVWVQISRETGHGGHEGLERLHHLRLELVSVVPMLLAGVQR